MYPFENGLPIYPHHITTIRPKVLLVGWVGCKVVPGSGIHWHDQTLARVVPRARASTPQKTSPSCSSPQEARLGTSNPVVRIRPAPFVLVDRPFQPTRQDAARDRFSPIGNRKG